MAIESLSHERRKARVIQEQNSACYGCRLTEWRGRPITLELEHKDGDRNNQARSNLEALCPNCHSQTPTWRGRNNSKKITDEELCEAIRQTSSLRKALVSVGMADKGGNYERAKRIRDTMLAESTGEVPPPFALA